MIEDKKIGLKVAENKYEETAFKLKKLIENMEFDIEINQVLLEYLESKK